MAGTVISRAGSVIWVRLAVSGWSIRCHVQPDGRTLIEVSDETGALTGLVAGTRLPIVSADAGWRGITGTPSAPGAGGPWPSGTRPPGPAGPPSPSRAGGPAAAARTA